MLQTTDFFPLPANLPAPLNDGAADHLVGMVLPYLELPATQGATVNLSKIAGWAVIFCYPMTGRPDVALPEGWDQIPGARGCTPQACAFRDYYTELKVAGATEVFGMSTQATAYQQEMAARLHLPFPVLSDTDLQFVDALRLPKFTVEGMHLMKRLTLIIENGRIIKVNYPVFPSSEDAPKVLEWFQHNTLKITKSS